MPRIGLCLPAALLAIAAMTAVPAHAQQFSKRGIAGKPHIHTALSRRDGGFRHGMTGHAFSPRAGLPAGRSGAQRWHHRGPYERALPHRSVPGPAGQQQALPRQLQPGPALARPRWRGSVAHLGPQWRFTPRWRGEHGPVARQAEPPAPAQGRGGRGGRSVGWSGPMFWPNARDDIFGFTLRPFAYGETFWSSAYDEVFDDVFWPPSHDASAAPAPSGPGPGAGERRDRRVAALSRDLVETCDDRAPGLTEWPFERLEQTVAPDGAQRAALHDLRRATADAMKLLEAACPDDMPATPTARLEVMEKRLAATLGAVDMVRPALIRFSTALTGEQKARFERIGMASAETDTTGSLSPRRNGRDGARICGSERVPRFAELSIRRIQRVVRPDRRQQEALEELKDATAIAAKTLHAACAMGIPANPNARLDAMRSRVAAMHDSVQAMRPALTHFYSLLSDDQKSRFNTMTE
jgi:hypothetical protein